MSVEVWLFEGASHFVVYTFKVLLPSWGPSSFSTFFFFFSCGSHFIDCPMYCAMHTYHCSWISILCGWRDMAGLCAHFVFTVLVWLEYLSILFFFYLFFFYVISLCAWQSARLYLVWKFFSVAGFSLERGCVEMAHNNVAALDRWPLIYSCCCWFAPVKNSYITQLLQNAFF